MVVRYHKKKSKAYKASQGRGKQTAKQNSPKGETLSRFHPHITLLDVNVRTDTKLVFGGGIGYKIAMETVLFTRKDSIYKELGCNCYDKSRNALNFKGIEPVIAHPPCRAWGKLKGMAKPLPGEKELALYAFEIIEKNGGILEHPKGSDLWKVIQKKKGFYLDIQQSDFGHISRKDTRLYISGIEANKIPQPSIILGPQTKPIESLSRKMREHTPKELAIYLINILKEIKNETL